MGGWLGRRVGGWVVEWVVGWVGGRTLMIKVTSAKLRYAANGTVAELGKKDHLLIKSFLSQ